MFPEEDETGGGWWYFGGDAETPGISIGSGVHTREFSQIVGLADIAASGPVRMGNRGIRVWEAVHELADGIPVVREPKPRVGK